MNTQDLVKQLIEATSKGTRDAAEERVKKGKGYRAYDGPGEPLEVEDSRRFQQGEPGHHPNNPDPDPKDDDSTVDPLRVVGGSRGGSVKVVRRVSPHVRRRREEGGHAPGSKGNKMYRIRVVPSERVRARAEAKKKGKQRSSTDIVRGARLALAERVIDEMYSGTIKKGSKAARDLSNIEGMKRIVRGGEGGAQKTARVLRTSVNKVLNKK